MGMSMPPIKDQPLTSADETTTEPPRSQRLQRSILADDVYEAAKGVIMDHVIKPGGRVSIEQMARDFDVSPTPIREALARLEAERLVTKEPLRGYRASDLLSTQELVALFDFRRVIEPWASARAAALITTEQRSALEAELSAIDAPDGTSYDDYRQLTSHDERFHRLIFQAAGNEPAARAHDALHIHLHQFRLHYVTPLAGPTIDEHAAIGEAILGGSSDDAAIAAIRHLDSAQQRLLESPVLGRDTNDPASDTTSNPEETP